MTIARGFRWFIVSAVSFFCIRHSFQQIILSELYSSKSGESLTIPCEFEGNILINCFKTFLNLISYFPSHLGHVKKTLDGKAQAF